MAWGRLDDKFHSHPKVIRAGNTASGAFARLISWSSDHKTDGHVPAAVALMYAEGEAAVLAKLVDVGLFDPVGDGYRLHNFAKWNPTAGQIAERREQESNARRAAGQLGGKRSAEARRSKQTQANTQAGSSKLEANTQANTQAKRSPIPNTQEASNEASSPNPLTGGGGGGESQVDEESLEAPAEPDAFDLASEQLIDLIAMSPELAEDAVTPHKLAAQLCGMARLEKADANLLVDATRDTLEALSVACTSERYKVHPGSRTNWVRNGIKRRLKNPAFRHAPAERQEALSFAERDEMNRRARILGGIDLEGILDEASNTNLTREVA